jgi:hypothetical protein
MGSGMEEISKHGDRSSFIIGGTTVIGVGIGFIFLKTSALFFVASILIGVGTGLLLSSIFSRK